MSLGTSRSECTHSAGQVGGSEPLGWIQVHSWGQRWPRAWWWVFILTLYAEQCLITSSSKEAKLLGLRAPQRAQVCALSHFSCVRLFAILWTIVGQAPLSMGFSRQEYWGGLPCPPPGDLPNPRIEPASHVSCIGRWVPAPPGNPRRAQELWLKTKIFNKKWIGES